MVKFPRFFKKNSAPKRFYAGFLLFDPSLFPFHPTPLHPAQCQDAHADKSYARHQESCGSFLHDVKGICVHRRSKEIGYPGPRRLAAATWQRLACDPNNARHPRPDCRWPEPRLPMPCGRFSFSKLRSAFLEWLQAVWRTTRDSRQREADCPDSQGSWLQVGLVRPRFS